MNRVMEFVYKKVMDKNVAGVRKLEKEFDFVLFLNE